MRSVNLGWRAVWCAMLAVTAAALAGPHLIPPEGLHGVAARVPGERAPFRPYARSGYGDLSLRFEPQNGARGGETRFVARGSGYGLILQQQEAVLSLRRTGQFDLSPLHRTSSLRALRQARKDQNKLTASVVRMHFEDANRGARMTAERPMKGTANYFVGNERGDWRTDVPGYAQVKYTELYPGVDLLFHGQRGRAEYDFVVKPGGDPGKIQLRFDGTRSLRVEDGDLLVGVERGELRMQKPEVYQEISGRRQKVAGRFVLRGRHRVQFAVGKYDRKHTLVLDPQLNYSTYIGGSDEDQGAAIAVDASGNAVIAGTTFSTDYPATSGGINTGPLATNFSGAAFVSVISADGTQELYSTYLAGSADAGDMAFGVAVDATGKIYVAGHTLSTDFPTTANALKAGPLASNPAGTGFLAKIDRTLSGANSLVYSSYIGGTSGDIANAVATDGAGNAYVAGFSLSAPGSAPANFPVLGGLQVSLGSVNGNAFLGKIDTTKSGTASLIYSTYLGGDGANAGVVGFGDEAFGVAADSAGNAYMVGTTASSNFPVMNAVQATAPLSVAQGTVFAAKIDTTKTGASSLLYGSYLGGDNAASGDFGTAIALGPSGIAYLTGTTSSVHFPTTTGALQTNGNAAGVAFVTLLDTAKTGNASLKYSTALGSGVDTGFGIAADTTGNAYVAGGTSSSVFPVTAGAFQKKLATGAPGDAFLTKINPAGQGAADLVDSTYFGGSGNTGPGGGSDAALAVALDAAGNAYLAGQAFSLANFPIAPAPGALQAALNGTSDAFVAKLTPAVDPDFAVAAPATLTVAQGGSGTLTVTVTPANGFMQKVTLACSGVPANATCMIAPASVTPSDGVKAVAATATVATRAPSQLAPPIQWVLPPPAVLVGVLAGMLLLWWRIWIATRVRMRLWPACVAAILLATAGCGGGGDGGTHAPTGGTPKGTTTLTITATSGALSHTATVQLTVD